jgi:hypothetical protein
MPEPLPVKAQGKLLPEDRSAAPLICSSALVHQVRDCCSSVKDHSGYSPCSRRVIGGRHPVCRKSYPRYWLRMP